MNAQALMLRNTRHGRSDAAWGISRTAALAIPKRRNMAYDCAGSATIEFSLVAIVLFTLLFACLDFSVLMYSQMTLQNAVRQAGRYAITGDHLPDPNHPGQTLSRVASITQVAQNAAMGLNVSAIQISSVKGGSGNAGGPGDTVTISLTAGVPLMSPLVAWYFSHGVYTTTASVSFRNEPFPPSNAL